MNVRGVESAADQTVTVQTVVAAHERIVDRVRRTPVMAISEGSLGLGFGVTLKLECLQHAGSFKARGSFNNALSDGALTDDAAANGLIAASGGNHGLAVAYVARTLGIAAEIFVPGVSSPIKVDRIRDLGATVHVVGEFYSDAQDACDERAAQSDALLIHPYDSALTVAGQGTMGIELLEQCGDSLDTVVVAVGGGGLAAGLAAALPHHVRIIAVEPETSRCFAAALDAGRPVDVDVAGVAADSLGAKRIGALPWRLLDGRAESVLVTDEAIAEARQRLWDDTRLIVEHGGAAALAALTSGVWSPASGERVAVVVCGSNTDPRDLVGGN